MAYLIAERGMTGAPAGSRTLCFRIRKPEPAVRQDERVESPDGIGPSSGDLQSPYRASERAHGAGEGNRNPAGAMASRCSTFELHLRGSG